MKKITLMAAVATLFFTSCENAAEKQAKATVKDLISYVDSVSKATPEYNHEYWKNVESGYKEREAKATAVEANLKEGERKDIADAQAKFEDYKNRYKDEKAKYDEKIALDKKQKLRDDLFGEGKVKADLALGWITNANIVEVYKAFVDKVEADKSTYTKEDWEEVRMMFATLNQRKDEIEKSLSGNEKVKIKEYQAKFTAIKIFK